MKNVLVACLLFVCLTGCDTEKVDAGFEGVVIRQPYFFGHGGVDESPIKPGRIYKSLSTTVLPIDMRPMQFTQHFEDLMSSDGVPLDFDAIIRLQITNSVKIIRDFGPEWYKHNVESEFANRVRQAVRKHGMNETAIDTKAIDDIDKEITGAMNSYLNDANIPIIMIKITVGRANPPDAIKDQRVETASQQQRVLTESQRKLAEDARLSAEESRAAADNAYRNAMHLSADQFIALERLKVQEIVGQSGKCVMIMGNESIIPAINIDR